MFLSSAASALTGQVSIQLVSPASGEFSRIFAMQQLQHTSFHSISFPSEWGDPHTQRISNHGYGNMFPFN